MQSKIYILILFILLLSIESCDIFSTRNPESPDIGNSGLLPATEPSMLIQNFENSLKSSNIENYMNCFYNFKDNTNNEFSFTPATDAYTQFPTIFNLWNFEDERRSITSIFSSINNENGIIVHWKNRKPIQETADSAIFTSDYIINLTNENQNIPNNFAGRLQFTMVNRDNGLWYISKWIDVNINVSDSIKYSWSMLKAYLYN